MSEDESSEQTGNSSKKRRLQNACDECRRRKIKCDSGERPANICTNCIVFRLECTHALAMAKKKRGPPKGTPRGHRTVQSLVNSILNPNKPFVLPDDTSSVYQILIDLAKHIRTIEEELSGFRAQQLNAPLCGSANDDSAGCKLTPGSYLDIDGTVLEGLSDDMKKLKVDPSNTRHFGNLSSIMLVKTAMSIKREYHEETGLPPPYLHSGMPVGVKRGEFWAVHPWQILPPDPTPPYTFPPPDLMHNLISLYFSQANQLMPFLHRPTFERSIVQGLHYRNRHFGALVLAVCAVASRMSDDPRVLCDSEGKGYRVSDSEEDLEGGGEKKKYPPHSAGWQWIRQIRLMKNSFTEPPSLYEVQMYGVYVMFMCATSTPEACWILVGLGVRLAQDVGAHRKRFENEKPTVEGELWKRAFWMLYLFDIYTSAFLGRPRALSIEDFDVDYPIDCDDEYWEHPDPEKAFKQPEGKISSISCWIASLKLSDILGIAQRTIFSVRRREFRADSEVSGLEWSERIVAELDSSLNKWVDSLPEHLKWNPDQKNIDHFKQSSALYSTYYWIQIQIHRPFIPIPGQNNILSFPSLAICANAARSCAHVIEVMLRRTFHINPSILMVLFNVGIMLLVNIWRGRRLKPEADIDKVFADVYKCMDMIRAFEGRWQAAGRFWDILYAAVSVTHRRHDQAKSSLDLKRHREAEDDDVVDDDDYSAVHTSLSSHEHGHRHKTAEERTRTIAGTRRVSAALAGDKWQWQTQTQSQRQSVSSSDLPSASASGSGTSNTSSPSAPSAPSDSSEAERERGGMFTLPVHSDELGSLPVHAPIRWSDSGSGVGRGGGGEVHQHQHQRQRQQQQQFAHSQFVFGRDEWSFSPSPTQTHLHPHPHTPGVMSTHPHSHPQDQPQGVLSPSEASPFPGQTHPVDFHHHQHRHYHHHLGEGAGASAESFTEHVEDGVGGGGYPQGAVWTSSGERFWADGLSTALGTGGFGVPTFFDEHTQGFVDPSAMNVSVEGEGMVPNEMDSGWNDWKSYMASVDEVLRVMNSDVRP